MLEQNALVYVGDVCQAPSPQFCHVSSCMNFWLGLRYDLFLRRLRMGTYASAYSIVIILRIQRNKNNIVGHTVIST